jgi:hypothetical protein
MKNSPDPSVHREREKELIRHVERLLDDDRLRIDTTRGRRPVKSFIPEVSRSDKGVELKRTMSEMGKPDRELEKRMPVGESLEVVVSKKKWIFFREPVGRLEVVCISPTKKLLAGESPEPMGLAELNKVLRENPPPVKSVPTTLVVMSTSGFTREAHELAERRADRTLIMVEPNDAGGWSVTGPVETKALVDLFDPEAEGQKRDRVREAIETSRTELLTGGVAADRVVARTQLPIQLVEAELKAYAKEHAGLVAKRLDGRVVLFQEGSSSPAAAGGDAGGSDMPFIDKVKSLFARKGENEKKIAFLSERKAALSQQRDRAYEDINSLEGKEEDLRRQFKDSSSAITKRRVTTQLLQLRKDIERRHQLVSVLNQQVNVVSTHLHNLELVQQGQVAKLPDSDEIATDAAKAEEVLAELEASNELAGSVGAMTLSGLTAEEQALYEELEKEAGGGANAISLDTVRPEEERTGERAEKGEGGAAKERRPQETAAARPQPQRNEPEAG